MASIEYSQYCVAFLDILGFKNLIGTEDASTIHTIFNNIRRARKYIHGQNHLLTHVNPKTDFYFFSDSIVIAIPMSEPKALEFVASHCMLLQHVLWHHDIPTWVRGGIAIGNLYCGNGEVFGPALIDAYRLEEKAVYPRIIMSEETYKKGVDNEEDKEDILFITKQPNDLRMVETLSLFRYGPQRSRLIESVRKTLKEESNDRILEKFQWVAEYHNIDVEE